MRSRWLTHLSVATSLACSDADSTPTPPRSAASEPGSSTAEVTEVGALTPTLDGRVFIVFMEPETGFMTDAVHDADREVVHFDDQLGAMVSAESGDAITGWDVDGVDLRWSRGGAFRVRFGTEQGERRAFFTETGPGTICNLTVAGPDVLSISPTRETPPNP